MDVLVYHGLVRIIKIDLTILQDSKITNELLESKVKVIEQFGLDIDNRVNHHDLFAHSCLYFLLWLEMRESWSAWQYSSINHLSFKKERLVLIVLHII